MKVQQFTRLLYGGAGVAVQRLHEGLLRLGIDSRLWYQSGQPWVSECTPQRAWYGGARSLKLWMSGKALLARHKLGLDLKARGFFTGPRLPCATPLPFAPGPDTVLQLHWITLMLDYPSFFASVPADMPVVWTAHDLNPLTGGCHYTGPCRRFEDRCGECPVLERGGPGDPSAVNLGLKEASIRHLRNLHVVGDSRWVESMARRSRIFAGARSFRTIHYGLDTEVFCPGDRAAARRELGLSPEAYVVAFGAYNLGERRKGGYLLAEALKASPALAEAEVLVFGHDESPFAGLKQRVVAVGPAEEPSKLVSVYRAADVFAMPSLEEAFGQTALESMACGTPVVGSDVGGIPDMLRGNGCGLLVAPGDATTLREALETLGRDDAERRRMGIAAREVVLARFTLAEQARRYAALYGELLSGPTPVAAV